MVFTMTLKLTQINNRRWRIQW